VKVIYINVALFAILYVVGIFFEATPYLALPANYYELLYRPWTLLTYMFTHRDFLHILFNMLWLYWFGKIFMQFLHNKQFLSVYLLGGFFGAAFQLLTNYFLTDIAKTPTIGASAAVMSVVFAITAYKPDFKIYLLFIGPVKIKYIAIVSFFIDFTGVLSDVKTGGAMSGVAHFAHLGGAFYGLLWGYQMKLGRDINRGFSNILDNLFSLFKPSKKQMHISYRNPDSQKIRDDKEWNKAKFDTVKEMDRILDKISQTGYDSLTKDEKEFLFKQKR
jgi:membrane associated rhomboid family serine protease